MSFGQCPGIVRGQQLPEIVSIHPKMDAEHPIRGKFSNSGNPKVPFNKTFKPGDVAIATGVYRVSHTQHRLPHQVVVLRGDQFPKCAKCTGAVSFKFFYSAPFVVSTYKNALPVLDDDVPDAQAAT